MPVRLRVRFSALCCVGFALVAMLHAQETPPPSTPAQSMRFSHQFGGREPGQPGFRVQFDTRGACVWSIVLLDHDAPRVARDEEHVPYEIVQPEYVEPGNPSAGVFAWFLLGAEQPRDFSELQGGLDLEVWQIKEQAADVVRFELDAKNGLIVEKTYAYDAGRRDLRFELALRATDASKLAAGEKLRLNLGGVGLAAPVAEWVLGANPSLAVGAVI